MSTTSVERPVVCHDAALFIDPPSHHFLGDRLFHDEGVRYGGDQLMAPYRAVRAEFETLGIPVHTADALVDRPVGGRNLYVSMGYLEHYRTLSRRPDTIPSAYIGMECPIVEPRLYRAFPDLSQHFRRIFSWTTSEHLKPFTGVDLSLHSFCWPQSFDRVHDDLWARTDRRFLMMMNANKLPRLLSHELYTERLRAVAFFEGYGEIDLYGPRWDRRPVRVGTTWVPWSIRKRTDQVRDMVWSIRSRVAPDETYAAARRAWRGRSESKSETLASYRFAICFENMALHGWMTEKLFDCLFAGTIPIYYGAPDVCDRVPSECFIDMRSFDGYDELRRHLHSLRPHEIERYREAGRDFLESPAFDPFRTENFVALFRRLAEEDGLLAASNNPRLAK